MVSSHAAAVRNTGHVTYQLAPTGNSQYERGLVRDLRLTNQKKDANCCNLIGHIGYSVEDCDQLQLILDVNLIHIKFILNSSQNSLQLY